MEHLTFMTNLKNLRPMNKTIISLLLPSMLFFCSGFGTSAQTDSRNRKPETVVADGLAELPASNNETYARVIGEIAATGATGIDLLTSMLSDDPAVDNSKAEFAINGVVNFVSAQGKEEQRKSVHDALVKAIKASTDDVNREFLLSQLNKLATAADFGLYTELLSDAYLAQTAVSGLASMPGADALLADLINKTAEPLADLAYIAYFRRLPGVETQLIEWSQSSEPAVRMAATNALGVCGSATSIKHLAESDNFDAYLQLLDNLGTDKAAVAAAKRLFKSKDTPTRCAGIRLLLKADPANATKNVLNAIKDADQQVRHTALLNAIPAAEEGIVAEIAAKYPKLPVASKIDVLNWLGDIHATAQAPLVCKAVADTDQAVSLAAIEAAGKLGGNEALETLIALIGGTDERANAAKAALLSFDGNIAEGVLKSLDSKNSSIVESALALASTRHIHNAYPKVAELTKSTNAEVAKAAFAAIDGVATVDNFPELCTMLAASKGDATAQLQKAAAGAIASLPAKEQYEIISRQMAGSSRPELFFPLLSQSGTPEAIATLTRYASDSNAEALDALLKVNNPAVTPDLYAAAVKASGKTRDRILGRYVTMVSRCQVSPDEKYAMLNQALELNPGNEVRKNMIAALAAVPTLPAAMLAAQYLGNASLGFTASNSLVTIVGKNAALQSGEAMKKALQKAIPVFQAEKDKGDADAGYAIDKVNGFLQNWPAEGGYTELDATRGNVSLPETQENFELFFDFVPDGQVDAIFRGASLLTWNNDSITFAGKKSLPLRKGINSLYVRMQDDRAFVDVNGQPLAANETVAYVPGTKKKIAVKGTVKFDGDFIGRNFCYLVLPTTPIYILSPEEEAEGFELLFDGRSLENFHGNTTAYMPKDGHIYVTAQYGGTGNLYTKKNYSDFIFRFEFCFGEPGVNNGVGIRTGRDVTGVDAAYYGMEIQILDHDDPSYQGKNYGYKWLHPYQEHGSVYGITVPEHVDFGPIGTWHTEEIKAVGDQITVTVDGKVINDVNVREAVQGHNVAPEGADRNPYTLDGNNHPGLFNKEGYISFCGHGPGVMFRNIRVLDLSDKAAKKARKKAK